MAASPSGTSPSGELWLNISNLPPRRIKLSPGQLNDLGDLPVHRP